MLEILCGCKVYWIDSNIDIHALHCSERCWFNEYYMLPCCKLSILHSIEFFAVVVVVGLAFHSCRYHILYLFYFILFGCLKKNGFYTRFLRFTLFSNWIFIFILQLHWIGIHTEYLRNLLHLNDNIKVFARTHMHIHTPKKKNPSHKFDCRYAV